MDISRIILSDPVNKWIFKTAQELQTDIFLVGGYVRDLLRGIQSHDKDFVVINNVKEIAIRTAKKYNGTFIILKHGLTYRVVLKNKPPSPLIKEILDFSNLKTSLESDLKKRDFTINAIAWSPKTGISDPFGGRLDLNKKKLKAIMATNLHKDPLRMIRAYRIASELAFKIEPSTRNYIKQNANRIIHVAHERITEEFFKILSAKNSINYLNQCHDDNVLENILQQTKFINKIDMFNSNMSELNKFDIFCRKKITNKKILNLLREEVNQKLNRLGLLRLVILFKNYSIEKSLLRVSNNINNALKDINDGIDESKGKFTYTKLYKMFNASGERVTEMIFLLSFMHRKKIKKIYERAEAYLKIKNKILLNGDDIQRILGIKPGKRIGNILKALQEERLKGRLKTRTEARKWLISNFT